MPLSQPKRGPCSISTTTGCSSRWRGLTPHRVSRRRASAPRADRTRSWNRQQAATARSEVAVRVAYVHAMKQLSGVDTGFLNMETATQFGHVASLIILDPSTSETGDMFANVRRMFDER